MENNIEVRIVVVPTPKRTFFTSRESYAGKLNEQLEECCQAFRDTGWEIADVFLCVDVDGHPTFWIFQLKKEIKKVVLNKKSASTTSRAMEKKTESQE